VHRPLPVKVLGDGELKTRLAVSAHAFSASAKQKIEKAGGSVEQLSLATPKSESSGAQAGA